MPKTILVVEDHDDSRQMIRFMLEMFGFAVLEAGDGQAAIEGVKKDLPDLILMDISMPGMDGLAATRRIKEMADAVHIPVICMTAYGNAQQTEAIAAGCVDVVPKPVVLEQLNNAISRNLIHR